MIINSTVTFNRDIKSNMRNFYLNKTFYKILPNSYYTYYTFLFFEKITLKNNKKIFISRSSTIKDLENYNIKILKNINSSIVCKYLHCSHTRVNKLIKENNYAIKLFGHNIYDENNKLLFSLGINGSVLYDFNRDERLFEHSEEIINNALCYIVSENFVNDDKYKSLYKNIYKNLILPKINRNEVSLLITKNVEDIVFSENNKIKIPHFYSFVEERQYLRDLKQTLYET